MNLLTVRDLRKHFGGVHAVAGISFELQQGEMLALIGPNGAGKSTCFNCLDGQLRADGGEVLFKGERIDRMPTRKIWRLGVGRTFQITATLPSMTVAENLQMALLSWNRRLHNIWIRASAQYRDRALELLEQIGLSGQADLACSTLAYGDLKRLELALALAHDPELLLMDEPTAGMAPDERLRLMDLVRDLARKRNISVLFTEHDMDIVFGHADRILVMHRGEVLAEGSPEEIRGHAAVREVYFGKLVD